VLAQSQAGFDAAAAASRFWEKDLSNASAKASDLPQVLTDLQHAPAKAREQHGRRVGLGETYFFVRGSGRILSREGSRVRLAVGAAGTQVVELRLGPVFGNTVRDGTGLLDVNQFPGLDEYNSLSTELNAMVERRVLTDLRTWAQPGVSLSFWGCAVAPEEAPAVGAPLLVLIPLKAEITR